MSPERRRGQADLRIADAWSALEPSIVALATGALGPAVALQTVGAALKVMTDQTRRLADLDKKVQRLLEGPLKAGKEVFSQVQAASSEEMKTKLLNDARLKFTEAEGQLTGDLKLEAQMSAAMVFSLLNEPQLAKNTYTKAHETSQNINTEIHNLIDKDANFARKAWLAAPFATLVSPIGLPLLGFVLDRLENSAIKKGVRLYESEHMVRTTTNIMRSYNPAIEEFKGVFDSVTGVTVGQARIKTPAANLLTETVDNKVLWCERKFDIPWNYYGLTKTFYNLYTGEPVRTF